MRKYIDPNYIIWSLISIPILVGSFLIFREGMIKLNSVHLEDPILVGKLKSLATPPAIVKGIYFTSTSSGNDRKIDHLIDLANKTELNAVVIDIKDSSGYISYDSVVPEAEKYKTELVEIKDIDSLVRRLHENNIYIIARMTVFQDPILARARPDWTVKNKYTGGTWYDHKRLAWIDPANREAWKYFVALAKDVLSRGVDEINLDYIRFPSDGNLETMVFPAWDRNIPRTEIIKEFYKYMRSELGDSRMSADLFGFVTTRTEDFGVGQILEDAFEYFDFVLPMVYPSHYPNGFLGFANPAAHPYEVVNHTIKSGMERLKAFEEQTGKKSNLRPWIQDFNLGADYTEAMVRDEIKATQDALGDSYNGFMLWNAKNVYHEGVF